MIRIIYSRRPGVDVRSRIVYRGRWVRWAGFAILPFGCQGRRWVGLALEIPDQAPDPAPGCYDKHDTSGKRYPIDYDPQTRDKID